MGNGAHLYFHSPCFDGIVSCVLAWDFLETCQGWSVEEIHSVNYDAKASWLSTSLNTKSAVVDFLYHPDADFWADHHGTTFLNEKAKEDFERRRSRWLVYDKRSGSCALLLWKHFADFFGYRNPRYESLVEWAERIDSARYASVEEAIFGTQPALRINLSLAGRDGQEYCSNLVKLLKRETLDDVAALPEVKARSEHAESMIRAGMDRFAKGSRLEHDGIAVFDVDSTDDAIISRYAPYYRFPEARYSVGVVRSPKGASIKAMRNPWREFLSVPLGEIFSRFGGGGHQRVGALVLPKEQAAEASPILDQIISEIRKEEGRNHDPKSEFL
jgi:hypothetical protein